MAKLVIVGIDGLDPILINKWKEELPNFANLLVSSPQIITKSTIPPDSICAWVTIFTGCNPAEHGFLELTDYLSMQKYEGPETEDLLKLKGATFWDVASSKGKNVCIINPFLAYPAWEVNGVMVSGPVFESGNISAYPEAILNEYEFPPLGGIVDFPDEKELDKFIIRTKELTTKLARASLKMYKNIDHDLFFVTFLTLDRIKHFLWRFNDPDDPYYPGENAFKNTIKEFYILFDNIIGDFKNAISHDTAMLVISDHGLRKRCTNSLNLNEFLRTKGYIATRERGIKGVLGKILQKAKIFAITTLSQCNMQDYIYKIAKFIPNRKSIKKSTYLIDKNTSTVSLSSICGTSSFGGIDINIEDRVKYENLRTHLMNDLMGLNSTLRRGIVKWVDRRENIYQGKYEKNLPDLFFELDEEFNVGSDFFVPLVTPDYTHKKKSGGHKREGVLLLHSNNTKINNLKRPVSIIDIKDYLLKIIEED